MKKNIFLFWLTLSALTGIAQITPTLTDLPKQIALRVYRGNAVTVTLNLSGTTATVSARARLSQNGALLPNAQQPTVNSGSNAATLVWSGTATEGMPAQTYVEIAFNGAVKIQAILNISRDVSPATPQSSTFYVTLQQQGVGLPIEVQLSGSGGSVPIVDAYTKSQTDALLNNKANLANLPTNTSQLINDSGYLNESGVRSTSLGSGLSITATQPINATASIVQAFGRLQGQINSLSVTATNSQTASSAALTIASSASTISATNTAAITGLIANTAILSGQITALSSNSATQASQISSLSTTVQANTSNIASLSTSVSSINSTVSSNTSRINSLSTTAQTNTSNITSLSATVQTNTSNITSLSTTAQANTSNITSLSTTAQTNTNNITSLSASTYSVVNSTTGTFGSSTAIPIVTVDRFGKVTNVSTTTFAAGSGTSTTAISKQTSTATSVTVTCNANALTHAQITTTGNTTVFFSGCTNGDIVLVSVIIGSGGHTLTFNGIASGQWPTGTVPSFPTAVNSVIVTSFLQVNSTIRATGFSTY